MQHMGKLIGWLWLHELFMRGYNSWLCYQVCWDCVSSVLLLCCVRHCNLASPHSLQYAQNNNIMQFAQNALQKILLPLMGETSSLRVQSYI